MTKLVAGDLQKPTNAAEEPEPPQIPLVEIGQTPEFFTETLGMVQRVAGNFKLTFVTATVPVDCGAGDVENTVRVRLIIPAESVGRLRRQLENIERDAIEPKPRAELRAVQ